MEIYNYQGIGRCESKCGLDIYMRGDRAIVMFTELRSNPGTSVTNWIECLATLIYNERFAGCSVESIKWIEHYEGEPDNYSEVIFTWDGKKFINPRWRYLKNFKWSDV